MEELADTTAATMATMAVTETRGRIFVTFSVKLENSLLMMQPSTMGTITTFTMDKNMLRRSTSTVCPAYSLVRSGVRNGARMVETPVMPTDRATSPFAR